MSATSSSIRSGMREVLSMPPSITAPATRHRSAIGARRSPMQLFRRSAYVCISAVTNSSETGRGGRPSERFRDLSSRGKINSSF